MNLTSLQLCLRKTFFLSLFLFFLIFPSSAFETPSPLEQPGNSYLQEGFAKLPEFTPGSVYQPGLAYSPFESNKANQFQAPVLYGPGGDPIGGIPVSDGMIAISILALMYLGLKMVKLQRNKNQ